jgi:hypothetical protein
MPELCYNSTRWVRGWFEVLEGVQDRMAQISHRTATNTKDFSLQKQKDLFLPDSPGYALRKDNLRQYCQVRWTLLVPDSAFEPSKDFLWLVGKVVEDGDDRLMTLFHCVAEKFWNSPKALPKYSWTPAFRKLTLEEAYGTGTLESNVALRTLDLMLRETLNVSFYVGPKLYEDRSRTIQQTIRQIFA